MVASEPERDINIILSKTDKDSDGEWYVVEPEGKLLFVSGNGKGECNDAWVNAFFIFQQVALDITWKEEITMDMRSTAINITDYMVIFFRGAFFVLFLFCFLRQGSSE